LRDGFRGDCNRLDRAGCRFRPCNRPESQQFFLDRHEKPGGGSLNRTGKFAILFRFADAVSAVPRT
ncbi:MAG: hypothetical protein K1Y36_30410, partial [Blastocatellia bacterium]|nr:hypothetical protein [Blastocatellia bacterium]